MKSVARILLLLLCPALLAGPAMAGGPQDGIRSELHALPPPGWTMDDSLSEFVGTQLFQMIDGGAALYMEVGFDRAVRCVLASGSIRVGLEVYRMNDDARAFAVYSTLAATSGTDAITIGQEGIRGEGFLAFWKGRNFVVLSTVEGDGTSALPLLGRIVDSSLAGGGSVPARVALFRERLHARQVFTFHGSLGYQQQRALLSAEVVKPREGLVGMVDSCDVGVILYKDDAEAGGIFREAMGVEGKEALAVEKRGTQWLGRKNEEWHALVLRGATLLQVLGHDQHTVQRVRDRVLEALNQP